MTADSFSFGRQTRVVIREIERKRMEPRIRAWNQTDGLELKS